VIYRKHGRVIRREGDVLIRVDEAGEAYERDGCFYAAPIDPTLDLPPLDATEVERTANAIADPIERLIVSEGIAAHSYGDEEWTDRTRRVHLALVNRGKGLRALLDFGDFDLDIVPRVADALARVEGERDAPERMRLAPNVAAALLPSLGGVQAALGVDGNGVPIEERVAAPPHPNVWRPSYRIRPVPMPFHLRAEATGDIDRDLPEAIALLGPSRFLIVDGSRAFAATFTVRRVLAVGEPQRWFPYGAGAFGAEMIVAG
jgi:hypothetical protein